jgi:hypothetical protein
MSKLCAVEIRVSRKTSHGSDADCTSHDALIWRRACRSFSTRTIGKSGHPHSPEDQRENGWPMRGLPHDRPDRPTYQVFAFHSPIDQDIDCRCRDAPGRACRPSGPLRAEGRTFADRSPQGL